MPKMTYYDLYEIIREYSLEKYIQNEDLHKYLTERPDGSEYSPVGNFWSAIVAEGFIHGGEQYLNSRYFQIACEVLYVDKDFLHRVLVGLRNAD